MQFLKRLSWWVQVLRRSPRKHCSNILVSPKKENLESVLEDDLRCTPKKNHITSVLAQVWQQSNCMGGIHKLSNIAIKWSMVLSINVYFLLLHPRTLPANTRGVPRHAVSWTLLMGVGVFKFMGVQLIFYFLGTKWRIIETLFTCDNVSFEVSTNLCSHTVMNYTLYKFWLPIHNTYI